MTAPWLCVNDPEIDEVINLETDIISPARAVIGSDYGRLEEIVADSLRRTPNFSEIESEKVWRGMDRSK